MSTTIALTALATRNVYSWLLHDASPDYEPQEPTLKFETVKGASIFRALCESSWNWNGSRYF